MSTIFPLSASVGQEFQGYMYDGTIWNLIGNEYNPTVFSSTPPANPKPGDLWVDSDSNVDILNEENLVSISDLNSYLTIESASNTYLTQANASSTYATKTELENIDLSPYLTISSASTTYATKEELESIDLSSASAAAVSYLVDGAPNALNTLNELAAALNDDESFATTVTNSLAEKQKLVPYQSSAPSSPSTGDMWIDSSTNPPALKTYNGSSWVQLGSAVDDAQAVFSSRMFA